MALHALLRRRLIVLVLGHMFIMLMLDGGVHRLNFAFVAGRWSSPFWQFWDLTMLWLAQLHGGNGLRTVIADYSRKDSTRFWLTTILVLSMILIMGLGTYVIFTFDPISRRARGAQTSCRNIVMTWSSSAPVAQACVRQSKLAPVPARPY